MYTEADCRTKIMEMETEMTKEVRQVPAATAQKKMVAKSQMKRTTRQMFFSDELYLSNI